MKMLHMPSPNEALPGRNALMPVPAHHAVLGAPMQPPFPRGYQLAMFGMVASGARRRSIGNWLAFTPRRWAMPVASRPIRCTRKCAAG